MSDFWRCHDCEMDLLDQRDAPIPPCPQCCQPMERVHETPPHPPHARDVAAGDATGSITILADAFGVRWLRCVFHAGWLYAGTIGPVAKSVPIRVVYRDGWLHAAEERAKALRAAGYERVSVEVDNG